MVLTSSLNAYYKAANWASWGIEFHSLGATAEEPFLTSQPIRWQLGMNQRLIWWREWAGRSSGRSLSFKYSGPNPFRDYISALLMSCMAVACWFSQETLKAGQNYLCFRKWNSKQSNPKCLGWYLHFLGSNLERESSPRGSLWWLAFRRDLLWRPQSCRNLWTTQKCFGSSMLTQYTFLFQFIVQHRDTKSEGFPPLTLHCDAPLMKLQHYDTPLSVDYLISSV